MLYGGPGQDILDGGPGHDEFSGGREDDEFRGGQPSAAEVLVTFMRMMEPAENFAVKEILLCTVEELVS